MMTSAPGVSARSLSAITFLSEDEAFSARLISFGTLLLRCRLRLSSLRRSLPAMLAGFLKWLLK